MLECAISKRCDTPDPLENTNKWAVSGLHFFLLYLVFSILFALLAIGMLVGFNFYPHSANDFFAFDSFSMFIRTHPPASIYNQQSLRDFQNLPGQKLFAFMYHPGMMLMIWPLAYLPYDLGYALWIGVGLVACAFAVAVKREGWPLALMVVVAPSTLWTALCGQSSLLVTALLIGGVRLSGKRPLLAGVLIGLATYKPQLGILVPVALLAARRWQTILSTMATGLTIVILSTAMFGLTVWTSWFHHIQSIIDVRNGHSSDWSMLLATVSSNLASIGVGRQVADQVQLVSFLCSAVCVIWCFRQREVVRDGELLLQGAALGVATFLATPFAFIYDMPLLTASVLLFVEERRQCNGSFRFREVLAIVIILLLPCLMITKCMIFCSSLVLLVMLGTIVQRLRELRLCSTQLGYGVTI